MGGGSDQTVDLSIILKALGQSPAVPRYVPMGIDLIQRRQGLCLDRNTSRRQITQISDPSSKLCLPLSPFSRPIKEEGFA